MRCLFISVFLLTAAQAAAQSRPAPGDTLRFVQSVKMDGSMDTPMGPQTLNAELEHHSIVAFLSRDSAVMWLDSIASKTASGPVDMRVMYEQLRGKRITLRILPDGRLQPSPQSLEGFGLPGGTQLPEARFWLPGNANLRRGATWADTSGLKTGSVNMTSINRYEVMGDSVYEGSPVTVVRVTTDVSSNGAGEMVMNGKGQGTGRAYFSRALGVIVHGVSAMQMEMTMQAGNMSMTARQSVQATTRLVRK